MIEIREDLYPHGVTNQFVKAEGERIDQIQRGMLAIKELKKGDRVKYNVNLVDVSYDGIEATYTINRNPNDILTYTKFDLLLCPIGGMFERLKKYDTPETVQIYRRKNIISVET